VPKVTFKNPPEPVRSGSKPVAFESEAKQLRARPGKWALLREGVSQSFAANIQGGRYPFLPPGEFECVFRTSSSPAKGGRRLGDVYVRYVGEDA
jgi:hypothetical protein